ncbi:MAG: DNA repair protein RadC, partial [Selenomonadaceae bacterium]|nr:DNA repair protein RadC [Selenomonadaceae bacterium]
IGRVKEMKILAARELAKRLAEARALPVDVIHGPEDVARYAIPRLRYESRENFCILLLNAKNHIIGFRKVSIGSLTASVVHPREVFEEAVLGHAAAIILLHNHPSGDPSPSREDIQVTERMIKAGEIMDIPVLDHVVIGRFRFFSMKEKGVAGFGNTK